jgi:hypothetical protein
MALFQIQKYRYLDTDHIADIKYLPATQHRKMTLDVGIVGGLAESMETFGTRVSPARHAHLRVVLKAYETIELEGEEATAAWESFLRAWGQDKAADEPTD